MGEERSIIQLNMCFITKVVCVEAVAECVCSFDMRAKYLHTQSE